MPKTELIIIGGKPYSGKTSLSKLLGENKDIKIPIRVLSMGERLRAIGSGKIKSNYTELLANSTDALKHHFAVPKEAALAIFEEFVAEQPDSLIILDGFPRYPDRLEGFEQSINRLKAKVLAVCRVDVDDSVVFERSKNREQRYADVAEDDSFIQKRLEDYQLNVLPTLNALAHESNLYVLDGTKVFDTNLSKLWEIINSESRWVE
jgi:adenylate kinase family enzyme